MAKLFVDMLCDGRVEHCISQQWNSSEVTRIAGELLSAAKNGGARE